MTMVYIELEGGAYIGRGGAYEITLVEHST